MKNGVCAVTIWASADFPFPEESAATAHVTRVVNAARTTKTIHVERRLVILRSSDRTDPAKVLRYRRGSNTRWVNSRPSGPCGAAGGTVPADAGAVPAGGRWECAPGVRLPL